MGEPVVAFQGERGAYSEEAIHRHLGDRLQAKARGDGHDPIAVDVRILRRASLGVGDPQQSAWRQATLGCRQALLQFLAGADEELHPIGLAGR